jgi:hypothetical protein
MKLQVREKSITCPTGPVAKLARPGSADLSKGILYVVKVMSVVFSVVFKLTLTRLVMFG